MKISLNKTSPKPHQPTPLGTHRWVLGLVGASMLFAGLAFAQPTNQPPPTNSFQAIIDSYRRQDWTGSGPYHRPGMYREQRDAVRQYKQLATAGQKPREDTDPNSEPEASEPPSWLKELREHVSFEGHGNVQYFRSDNIFNTETAPVTDTQWGYFVGAGVDLNLGAFQLATTYDQSWYRYDHYRGADYNVGSVRQGLGYGHPFLDGAVGVNLTPYWQYSELRNAQTGVRFCEQLSYGMNNQIAWYPTRWLIATFSYNFAFEEAQGSEAPDKLRQDFNLGCTLIPIKGVNLYFSPSVQFSHEAVQGGSRRDNSWTPTASLTYQPLSFLAVDASVSYTDSQSNTQGDSFNALAGTVFVRLFWNF